MSVFVFNYLFPLSILGLGAAAIAHMLFLHHRQRRRERYEDRFRRGQCLSCGYDLRGASGRCPECGRPIDPRRF